MAEEKPLVFRIGSGVTRELTERFDGLVTRGRGLDRTEATRRMLEWLLSQSELVQQWVLGQLPQEAASDLAAIISEIRVSVQREKTIEEGTAEELRRDRPASRGSE